MGFNPSHCELCGTKSDKYYEMGGLVVCETCVPEHDRMRADEAVTMVRKGRGRIPALSSRQRNAQVRSEHFEKNPCTDCGLDDADLLEFDHVPSRGKKFHNISKLVATGAPLSILLAEMEKCDVVCCNCHRRRTVIRRKDAKLAHQSVYV